MTVLINDYTVIHQLSTGELAIVLDEQTGDLELCQPVDSYWVVLKYAEPGAITSQLKKLALELAEDVLGLRRHADGKCCECGGDHECCECQDNEENDLFGFIADHTHII